MRIGIDARMLRITGIGRYTQELIKGLCQLKIDILVFIAPADEAWFKNEFKDVPYRVSFEQIYSWSEQLLLPGRMQKEDLDLVHFTNFNVPVSIKIPFVTTVHDLTPLRFGGERRKGKMSQRAYSYALSSSLKRCRRVMVPSEMVIQQLPLMGKDLDKIERVPYAVGEVFRRPASSETKRFMYCKSLGIDKPYIMYAGNFRNHKNIPTLLQAFSIFNREHPGHQLVLVGKHDQAKRRALTSLSKQLSIEADVVLTDEVSDSNIVDIYDGASMFVLPSFAEGYGLVALEAASRGVPLAVSETTPIREILGKHVVTFNPNNVEQLADTIAFVLNEKDLTGSRMMNAQSAATKRTWMEVAQDVTEVYRNALQGSEVNK